MDQFFSVPRLSLEPLRSSFLQSHVAGSTASFTTTSPHPSLATNRSRILQDVAPSGFRDGTSSSVPLPFNPTLTIQAKPPVLAEKLAYRSVETANFDVSRSLSLLRSISHQSVTDLSAFALPGEGYIHHPSFEATSQSPQQSPQRNTLPLKRLFTIRSMIRFLPVDLLDTASVEADAHGLGDEAEEFFCLGKRKCTDDVSRGGPSEPKRSRSSFESRIHVGNTTTHVIAHAEKACPSFLKSTSLAFASLVSHQCAAVSLEEALHLDVGNADDHVYSAIEHEMDRFCNDSFLDPKLFASQLRDACVAVDSDHDSDSEMEGSSDYSHAKTLDVIQERIAIQTLDDLVACVDFLHGDLSASIEYPALRVLLYRLFSALIFAFVCRCSVFSSLLEKQKYRKQRNSVISTFFKAVLKPVMTRDCVDVVAISKAGLAHLDAKQKKIPRDVVDSVLRPALLQFCDLQKIDMRLLVGLHSIVELFPTLFKEVFAKKILDTLHSFQDIDALCASMNVPRADIVRMIVYMLDFFRLFASTGAFSCVQWIEPLSEVVTDLESKCLTVSPREGCRSCTGFRAPFCRLVCHYPEEAATIALGSSPTTGGRLISSIMSCRHCAPIRCCVRKSTSMFSSPQLTRSPQFADVMLMDASSGKTLAAHRVVLSQRSEFFRSLFGNGMRESVESVIKLEDAKFQVLEVLLDFIYSQSDECGQNLCAADLMDLLKLADRFLLSDLVDLCEYHLQDKVTRETLFTMIDYAIGSSSCEPQLSPESCGAAGMGILRSCQAFMIANLGSLAGTLDMEDPRVVSLLASSNIDLLNPVNTFSQSVI